MKVAARMASRRIYICEVFSRSEREDRDIAPIVRASNGDFTLPAWDPSEGLKFSHTFTRLDLDELSMMKRLATVSCRSGGENFFSELFHFRRNARRLCPRLLLRMAA
jgi:hypothetical protein